ncbi:type I-E CRISPR-associated protein Cas7/Cse4/CasC [Corynebacterium uterequi]|uniref:CRISPR-associated protein Cas7/Cse4/CasC, subtype I-E/ECOLI n=1 Tax=Corynebacterium uterequi TaxID=1072256 RepID=A0A0G3HEG3_9CORY|nr:type I-E CRISPR-associated protein Cas7/Cse4/CasC [Corynebacterium uterequi]AKK11721.1 CRISPR-associated protein Cas7/Cse4/CasC, subtype I-E/ECOLI [Corynebacterium uterequi]
MSIVIDIHALQTIPPSLINRDDMGAPKSAIFGGVPRQRVSSQSWKRAIRRSFELTSEGMDVGLRSKRLPEQIVKRVLASGELTAPEALAAVQQLFKVAKIDLEVAKKKDDEAGGIDEIAYPTTKYLLFLSPEQINRAAEEIVAKNGEKFKKAEADAILDTKHSVDIAMFGRMLADAPMYNVDASVQVSHALSVHESQPEFDYYTAVDDVVEDAEETGAGMIGTTQMMSSTLYRFATVNLDGLAENLDSGEAAIIAAKGFISAFAESLPTGKQNSFAHNTLPELMYVAIRDTRSISLVNAFEEPVESSVVNRRLRAAEKLAGEERSIEEAYGMKPMAAFVVALNNFGEPFHDLAEKVTMSELLDRVESFLCDRSEVK